VDRGQNDGGPSTSLRAGFGNKGTSSGGGRDSGLCGLWVKGDHGMSMRRKREMIGKVEGSFLGVFSMG